MTDDFQARATALLRRAGAGLSPLQVQVDAARRLQSGGRLIAMLPTGAGKTLLAALPFAAGVLGPRQMIFMTPLRTLTDAQAIALRTQINEEAASSLLGLPWVVRAQTGAAQEDPRFISPTVVCTFDQALSSALSISYSTTRRQREINAGAVLTAYLVCDEIHLFPRDEALTTLLWLLRHRPDLPFTLMTATLSRPIADALARLLGADVIDGLPAEDANVLGARQRDRRVRWSAVPLDADIIAKSLPESPDGVALVVVNTIRRAQQLGRELGAILGDENVLVLHSRFYADDRQEIERQLDAWMGKDADRRGASRVLVATQVVEAGLDISAGLLFSEWAPANALVQRWGRCARWGGSGSVVIAPPVEDGLPAPYSGDGSLRHALEQTRAWLEEYASTGIEMTSEIERVLLDYAHAESDERWAAQLDANLRGRSTWIGEAIQQGAYSHAGDLIRRVDNRTVLVHGTPEELRNPWRASGFSLARGTLFGLLRAEDDTSNEADTDDDDDLVSFVAPSAPWVLKKPIWGDDDERRSNRPIGWEAATRDDLRREALFALNPKVVSYDQRYGLAFGSGPAERNAWSNDAERVERASFPLYRRETYREHIERMSSVYQQRDNLGPALWAVAPAIERLCEWPAGTLDRLTRAAIVLHDAGKLTSRWQEVIRAYQTTVGQPYEDWLVHTDQRLGVPLEGQGPHALSGAAHSLAIGRAIDADVNEWRVSAGSARWEDETLPSRVLATAIARHHGAELRTTVLSSEELLPKSAVDYLFFLLRDAGLPDRIVVPRAGVPYDSCLVSTMGIEDVGQDAEYVALAVVSRVLRLADQWSQEREGSSDEGS